MPFENKHRLDNTSSASDQATRLNSPVDKHRRLLNLRDSHGYDKGEQKRPFSQREDLRRVATGGWHPTAGDLPNTPEHRLTGGMDNRQEICDDHDYEQSKVRYDNEGNSSVTKRESALYFVESMGYDWMPEQREEVNNAGTSTQRDVSAEEKRKVLNNLDMKKAKDRIASAKSYKSTQFNENSHFIINYREITRYTQHKQLVYLNSAYEGYRNIKVFYNANRYNEWENKMCERMGIPKEE